MGKCSPGLEMGSGGAPFQRGRGFFPSPPQEVLGFRLVPSHGGSKARGDRARLWGSPSRGTWASC